MALTLEEKKQYLRDNGIDPAQAGSDEDLNALTDDEVEKYAREAYSNPSPTPTATPTPVPPAPEVPDEDSLALERAAIKNFGDESNPEALAMIQRAHPDMAFFQKDGKIYKALPGGGKEPLDPGISAYFSKGGAKELGKDIGDVAYDVGALGADLVAAMAGLPMGGVGGVATGIGTGITLEALRQLIGGQLGVRGKKLSAGEIVGTGVAGGVLPALGIGLRSLRKPAVKLLSKLYGIPEDVLGQYANRGSKKVVKQLAKDDIYRTTKLRNTSKQFLKVAKQQKDQVWGQVDDTMRSTDIGWEGEPVGALRRSFERTSRSLEKKATQTGDKAQLEQLEAVLQKHFYDESGAPIEKMRTQDLEELYQAMDTVIKPKKEARTATEKFFREFQTRTSSLKSKVGDLQEKVVSDYQKVSAKHGDPEATNANLLGQLKDMFGKMKDAETVVMDAVGKRPGKKIAWDRVGKNIGKIPDKDANDIGTTSLRRLSARDPLTRTEVPVHKVPVVKDSIDQISALYNIEGAKTPEGLWGGLIPGHLRSKKMAGTIIDAMDEAGLDPITRGDKVRRAAKLGIPLSLYEMLFEDNKSVKEEE